MGNERPDFVVRGRDGRDYPATRALLLEWVREGQVTPNHLIYDTKVELWIEAALHPDIGTAFRQRFDGPDHLRRGVLLLVAPLLVIGIAAYSFVFGYLAAGAVGVVAWLIVERDVSPLRKALGVAIRPAAEAALFVTLAAIIVAAASFDAVRDGARSREAQAVAKKKAEAAEVRRVLARQREEAERREAAARLDAAVTTIRKSATRTSDVAVACTEAGERLPADLRPRCRSAFMARAREAVQKRDLSAARAALTHASSVGATGADVARIEARVNSLELAEAKRRDAENARLAREREREHAAVMAERRRAVGRHLRERFLDSGMDVKVRVTGKNADRIQMEWVLFGDVWSHRMRKEGIIDELCNGGFKRIDLDDGYDWGVYYTCR